MKKGKKHNSNMSISTRITLSTVLGIIIPLLIVLIFSSVYLTSMSSYFNFSTVTTNSYSLLNQIQWGQTIATISNEIAQDSSNQQKKNNIEEFVIPLEKLATKVYIGSSETELYCTTDKHDTMLLAKSIVADADEECGINYFGENGMVIITHVEAQHERYLMVFANASYTVTDVTQRYTAQDFTSLVFGKTGLFLLFLVVVFLLSMLALSLITSKAITKPIIKLSQGADEIARGNLDYKIDYDSTNEIGKTVKSFNDMTSRLKDSLDEQSRIEESRKEMIAGVAHDLRTPLTSAKGYVEGLIDGIANTPEKQERYLKTIYSSTKDMEKLLDELLTISRLELGQIQLEKEKVSINGFMNDCAEMIALELDKKDFDFEYINHCDDLAYFEIDADRFARVLKNIIANSIKYRRNDVRGRVELEVQCYQKSVLISIADNGIGVESDSLTKIFDSFYRADKARSNVRDGSGIGLSVCKQIVEMHGGHIWATSRENKGLKIIISLERGRENETQ